MLFSWKLMIGLGSGEDISSNIYTCLSITVVPLSYMKGLGSELIERISILLPISIAFFTYTTMICLLLTAIIDPGIIPIKYILQICKLNPNRGEAISEEVY